MKRFCWVALFFLLAAPAILAANEKSKRHVVVVVWDGMRPDLVSEKTTPTLWRLAQRGVTFANHHSIFPTSTEVNGTGIGTGVYPDRNGLLANREYRPSINSVTAVDTGEQPVIQKGDAVSDGHYLALPTIAEIVQRAGQHAAIVGSKSVALLQDRQAVWVDAKSANGLTKFAAAPMPASVADATRKLLGPFLTDPAATNTQRNAYVARTMTEILWRDGLPAYSLLWLSEPDLTQHETSPGSPAAMAAIKGSDDALALVLNALQEHGRDTDVFVVSDHGFSTIERSIDFPAELHRAGFNATTKFKGRPQPGEIMVVGNGGTVLFYVTGHDKSVSQRLVDWLEQSDFAGVIFTSKKTEGTFPLAAIHLATPQAPGVVVALRWNDHLNRFGLPGGIITDSGRAPGHGSHATLGKFDVHNLLIAAGPDFAQGKTERAPTGNIDLAPTILHILGLTPPNKLDGRILTADQPNESKADSKTLEATRDFADGQWRQYLRVSQVGATIYFDEGNGAFRAPKE